MKVRNINSINYVEAEPARHADTVWPLASPIILDLFFGVAAHSYQVTLLLMAIYLLGAALGLAWSQTPAEKALTIYARPSNRQVRKAA